MRRMTKFLSLILTFSTMISCFGKEIFTCDATETSLRAVLEKSRAVSGKKEIVIADGTIYLKSPIVLDKRDSGLTLRGSGKTVISGGIPLQFSAVPGKPYWSAKIPDGVPEPQLLASKTANIPVAVYPHTGMAQYKERSHLIWLGSQYGGWDCPPREYELDRITIPLDQLPEFDVADAEFYLPHQWSSSRLRAKSVDREKGIVYFATLSTYTLGSFNKSFYQIRNIEAGLVPGSWMFHRATREIFYYPKKDETIASVKLTAAIIDRLLTLDGISGVTVENLAFADTNGTTTGKPVSSIFVSGSEKVTISHVTVRNSFGNGILCTETPKNRDIQILDSEFYAMGYAGVIVRAAGNCAICNCDIRDVGRTGIGAMTYRGSKLLIAKNKIRHSGYCGMTCSTYPEPSKIPYDVAIEDNDISQIMMDESIQDGAGIYMFGAENFRVNRNYIHETPTSGLRHGIYFDETSNHSIAIGNRVSTFFPVMIHKAQHIVFEDCKFDFNGAMTFDLVDSDEVTLKNCRITALEILFSAPKDGLKRENCQISGKVTEKVKKHGFTFAFDDSGVLRCTKIPAEKIARKLPHRIVCFGDSITAAGIFAKELQLYLSCRYPKEKIEVFNAGIGGDSAAGGFRRLERDVLSLAPDMVIISFGMNDVGRTLYRTRYPADEAEAKGREQGFQNYCENMKKIVDTLTEKGVEVVVMAPFPYDEYGTRPAPDDKFDYCNSIGLERLAEYCYGTFSSKHLFPMSRMMLCRLYAWFPELQVAKDRVHPDRRGHWVVANEIAKTVFRDLPAQNPIPFPMTQEMVEFSKVGKGKTFHFGATFSPMDTLLENGEVSGRTAILREKMEAWLAAEKAERQLVYFDDILCKKGLDPADTEKVDPVLDDFAKRWDLAPHLEAYRKARAQREQLHRNAEKAKKAYFDCLEKENRKEKRGN